MKKLELNELDDISKKNCHDAFVGMFGSKEREMCRQMIAISGVEMTTATLAQAVLNRGDQLPSNVLGIVYNALLWMEKHQTESN